LRSPALMSACSKAGCHAVLASLSERYPPLEGRSPTRYSPVCHSTCPLRDFRVRLACVRHAASVDSEPGSNSHVKGVVRPRAEAPERRNPINARPIGSALFNPFLFVVGSPPAAAARTDDAGRPILRCPRADSLGFLCVCLHALSSFQRTERPSTRSALFRPTAFRGTF
jgi:hypothetical protein